MSLTLGAAAILGGASLLGGVANAVSSNKQNHLAEEQFNENMRFQKYQYEDAKRFNALPHQIRLARQAGLNPSLLYGSGYNGSSVSSVGGVAPTASHQPMDLSFLPQSGASILSALTENDLAGSQKNVNESQEASNYANASKSIYEGMGQQIENANKNQNYAMSRYLQGVQGQLAETQAAYNMMSFDARLEGEYWQAQKTRADAGSALIASSWADKIVPAEYQQILANTALARSHNFLTDKQAREVIMSTIAKYGLSNDDAKSLWDASKRFLEEQVQTEQTKQKLNNRSGSMQGLASYGLQQAPRKASENIPRRIRQLRAKDKSHYSGGVR